MAISVKIRCILRHVASSTRHVGSSIWAVSLSHTHRKGSGSGDLARHNIDKLVSARMVVGGAHCAQKTQYNNKACLYRALMRRDKCHGRSRRLEPNCACGTA